MTGKARWTSYSDAMNKHPEDSLLLAYLRKQHLDDGVRISRHIDVEKCPRCRRKLNELKQVSSTLDTLGVMRSYQHYPELSVADTYARMQTTAKRQIPARTATKGLNYRQRPRKTAVRLISVPAAFGLAVLFTMAMLVFANLSGRLPIQLPLPEIKPGTSNPQVVVAHTSSPTPNPDLTATGNAQASATPVQTAISGATTKPNLTVCSSSQTTTAQWRLVICGYNFDSAHKVVLYASEKKTISQITLHVDQHGKFQFGLNTVSCLNLPIIIFGYEMTNSKPIFIKLPITSFGSCPVPTTTPVMGSPGFIPN